VSLSLPTYRRYVTPRIVVTFPNVLALHYPTAKNAFGVLVLGDEDAKVSLDRRVLSVGEVK